MRKILLSLAILIGLSAPALAVDHNLACQVGGGLVPCPDGAKLKSGKTIALASLPAMDIGHIVAALAAGGNPINGTVIAASTRIETPTIGTSSIAQHALPSGVAALLAADSSLAAANLTGNAPQAAISTALAAGGVAITGTVLTASTRIDAPSIGTNSSNQHSLPSGTGALLDANSGLNAGNISSGTLAAARMETVGPGAGTTANPTSITLDAQGRVTALAGGGSTFIAAYSAVVYDWGGNSPVAEGFTGLCTAKAANSGTNTFAGVTNPDVYRAIIVQLGVGWDGGAVTVTGTDATGAVVQLVTGTTSGVYASTFPFMTITSITKATVGASAAVATVGPYHLGFPANHRTMINQLGGVWGTDQMTGVVTADTVEQMGQDSGKDPLIAVFKNLVPDGNIAFIMVGGLQ